MKNWDIIPDIHGQRQKLEELLAKLGYAEIDGAYRHQGRRALFLGDYIDRGPDIRGALRIVGAMVEAGEAVALMGNHELNAIQYHTVGADGQPMRPHTESKRDQHAQTLLQFMGREEEWRRWLTWFKKLPRHFETEDFRAVHACWDDAAVATVDGREFDEDFLANSSIKGTPEHAALECLLKGPELDLPEGMTFCDKDGHVRSNIRVRWWALDADNLTYADVVMPPGAKAPAGAIPTDLRQRGPNYPECEKTVFVGHYWLNWQGGPEPLAQNVVCLDYSAGREGPLVACRWNGSVAASEFITVGGNGRRP
jgi:hypothetical protein